MKIINYLKERKLLVPLIVALVLRLILMPITLHPDLWGHSFTSYFLTYEGKLNPYDTLANLPPEHPLVVNFGVTDIFIYPPLTYFTLGFFRTLIKPFVDPNFLPFAMENLSTIYQRGDLMWNLFLFKLPYLFVDIGLAFLLAKLFTDSKKQRSAFILWLFNPLTLYATFMLGQFDILPTFFVVLSLLLTQKKKYAWAAFFLGVGGSYKMWPFLLLAPLAFTFGKTLLEKSKLFLVGLFPFIITTLPFLFSPSFRYMVFSPKASKMLFMGWNVSGAEVVFPFLLLLSVVYAISYYSTKKISLALYCLAILLLTFGVTHYHPQWFLWMTPFFIWQQVRDKGKYWEIVLTMLLIWLIITLLFEPSLSFGLFNPLNPNLNTSYGLSEFLSQYTNVFQLKSMVRSVFAGISAYYVFSLFMKERESIGNNHL